MAQSPNDHRQGLTRVVASLAQSSPIWSTNDRAPVHQGLIRTVYDRRQGLIRAVALMALSANDCRQGQIRVATSLAQSPPIQSANDRAPVHQGLIRVVDH